MISPRMISTAPRRISTVPTMKMDFASMYRESHSAQPNSVTRPLLPPRGKLALRTMSRREFLRAVVQQRHDCTMQEHRDAVLVFDGDGEVMAFPQLEDAAGWMESIDVLDGEYDGAFTPDGRVDAPGVGTQLATPSDLASPAPSGR
jgi:hypothetical protein